MARSAEIIAPLRLDDHHAFRIFNLILLGLILLFTLRVPDSRLVAMPLLLSPQVWYLFSYCNSDAFAVTVSFFAGCQVVVQGSALNRFLMRREGLRQWGSLLIAAVVFGLLFLLKKNFLVYTAFLLWVILLTIWLRTEKGERGILLRRVVAVCLVGLSLLAVKIAADYRINGLDRNDKIMQMRIKMAAPLFNPNTPLEKQHSSLSMKERGITLARIIHKDRWFEKTFRSAFGVYGYLTISAGFVLLRSRPLDRAGLSYTGSGLPGHTGRDLCQPADPGGGRTVGGADLGCPVPLVDEGFSAAGAVSDPDPADARSPVRPGEGVSERQDHDLLYTVHVSAFQLFLYLSRAA